MEPKITRLARGPTQHVTRTLPKHKTAAVAESEIYQWPKSRLSDREKGNHPQRFLTLINKQSQKNDPCTSTSHQVQQLCAAKPPQTPLRSSAAQGALFREAEVYIVGHQRAGVLHPKGQLEHDWLEPARWVKAGWCFLRGTPPFGSKEKEVGGPLLIFVQKKKTIRMDLQENEHAGALAITSKLKLC